MSRRREKQVIATRLHLIEETMQQAKRSGKSRKEVEAAASLVTDDDVRSKLRATRKRRRFATSPCGVSTRSPQVRPSPAMR